LLFLLAPSPLHKLKLPPVLKNIKILSTHTHTHTHTLDLESHSSWHINWYFLSCKTQTHDLGWLKQKQMLQVPTTGQLRLELVYTMLKPLAHTKFMASPHFPSLHYASECGIQFEVSVLYTVER
jgi:hypothetical protein